MKIVNRLCIKDWSLEALNGDRVDLKRGMEYTTSPGVINKEVTVFTNFWIKAPIEIFAEREDFRPYVLGMELGE